MTETSLQADCACANTRERGGCPASPVLSRDVLDAFEAIQGKSAILQSLIECALDDIGVDRISREYVNIIEADGIVGSKIAADFEAAVAMGYAALRQQNGQTA